MMRYISVMLHSYQILTEIQLPHETWEVVVFVNCGNNFLWEYLCILYEEGVPFVSPATCEGTYSEMVRSSPTMKAVFDFYLVGVDK